jgi:hypothetical protein
MLEVSDVFGPVDYLILEYPPGDSGEARTTLLRQLADRGVTALYDVMIARKEAYGSAHADLDLTGEMAGLPAAFSAFAGARLGLLGDEHVEEFAQVLRRGKIAVVLVYENRWAFSLRRRGTSRRCRARVQRAALCARGHGHARCAGNRELRGEADAWTGTWCRKNRRRRGHRDDGERQAAAS